MASVAFAFDGTNELAQAHVDLFVRNYQWRIATETREAIAAIVERSIREGIEPRKAQRLIEGTVGLDSQRAGAFAKFEASLSPTLAPSVRDRLLARKSAKLLRSRAETIARTETMGALNAGQDQALWQAKQRGIVEGKEVIITPDDALCPVCEPLDGEVVPIDEDFSTGQPYPPFHPRCRCTTAAADLPAGVVPKEARSTWLPASAAAATAVVAQANFVFGAGRLAQILSMVG